MVPITWHDQIALVLFIQIGAGGLFLGRVPIACRCFLVGAIAEPGKCLSQDKG